MSKVKIIAEGGINANGDVEVAKQLIDIATVAGCDYIKWQKRDPDLCVPEDQKNKEKIVPWREEPTTYLQYKKDIEFGFDEYVELFSYCAYKKIKMFSSVWDIHSAKFMFQFTDIVKIPSAKLTDWELLDFCEKFYPTRILSTGMSTEDEIDKAVSILDPQVILHTNSVYPTPIEDLNFGYIKRLKEKYVNKEIGLSSHSYGIVPLVSSVFLDVDWVEFHITLNHDMWGSDQKSSVEPSGVFKIVKGIRDLEKAVSKGYEERVLYPGEEIKLKALRGDL